MTLSKTQRALSYLAAGRTPAQAAEQAGVAPSTLRVAISRAKGKERCPCCRQVVREGFVVTDALAVQERQRLAKMIRAVLEERARQARQARAYLTDDETDDRWVLSECHDERDEVARILTGFANLLSTPAP